MALGRSSETTCLPGRENEVKRVIERTDVRRLCRVRVLYLQGQRFRGGFSLDLGLGCGVWGLFRLAAAFLLRSNGFVDGVS